MLEPYRRRSTGLGRSAQACALLSAGVSLLALAGWVWNRLILAQVDPRFIPMAPSTALTIVLIGAGLFVHARLPDNRSGGRLASLAALLAATLAGLLLAQFLGGFDLGLERFFVSATASAGAVPIGQMSPITATALLCAGLALLLLAMAPSTWTASPSIAGSLAAAVTATGFVVLLGHAYGTPPLYGSTIIPVALMTAASLFLSGLGVLAAAGPDAWPLRTMLGSSVRARLLRALLPPVLGLLVGEGWLISALLPNRRLNPAMVVALTILIALAALSGLITWIARRTGGTIEQAQAALRASEARFRAVTDTANEAIVSVDAHGEIVLWNRAAETSFGYSAAEAIGQPVTIIVPERFLPAHRAGMDRLLSTAASKPSGNMVEVAGRRKDGLEFPIELTVAKASVDTGTIVTAILRDVTERTRVQAERERLFRELEEALAQVRTLRGIISICAACKKIHTKGAWQAIESYVQAHTDAQFSHSLCPDCAARLYPELLDDDPPL